MKNDITSTNLKKITKMENIKMPLDENQKNSIVNKKTLLATLLGTGGGVAFVSAADLLSNNFSAPEVNNLDEEDCDAIAEVSFDETVVLEADESMSFAEAFKMQRELQGEGGIFYHNGQYYNSY